jgi:xylan 1,4-beta-xylosidase
MPALPHSSETFRNPILPGFYPDPSICRAEDDYYLVTSSFEYFPGIPLFHSRDLVHWRQTGHVLSRPSQLDLDGVPASYGIYAPTIRFHGGKFYVITTLRKQDRMHCFFVTTEHPAGPWSDPVWLEDAPGIDPSLFFDTDGRVWCTGNDIPPDGEQYPGQRAIWLQEIDLIAGKLVGSRRWIWHGAEPAVQYVEAPHIYRVDDTYYLLTAEGGTDSHHAVCVARSASVVGPYENNPHNPILTHHDLAADHAITSTGHADLVQTQKGEWWAVLLACRPYGGPYSNLGRETFLAPIRWEDGWPVTGTGNGQLDFEYSAPQLPEHRWPAIPERDGFQADVLAPQWNFLRTPRHQFWTLEKAELSLQLRPETLTEPVNPSFIGRRQQHINFTAQAMMSFVPGHEESAGLVLLQNDRFHFRFVVTRLANQDVVVRLIQRFEGEDGVLAERSVTSSDCFLRIQARGQNHSFLFATQPETWNSLYDHTEGHFLSSQVAGGFTGTYIGLYASSNGQSSTNVAVFRWFDYMPEN